MSKIQNHIECGKSSSFFLDSEGQVYSCGNNRRGQLGQAKTCIFKEPTLIPIFHHINTSRNAKIISVISGSLEYTHFLTEENVVYSVGRDYGTFNLGFDVIPDEVDDVSSHFRRRRRRRKRKRSVVKPTVIVSLLNERIVKVKASSHSMFLNSKGDVFVCGSNRRGQLGLLHRNEVSKIEKVTFCKEKFKLIAAGRLTSYFVTVTNKVYYVGDMYHRYGRNLDRGITPRLVVFESFTNVQIKDIEAGGYHVLVLTQGGRCFSGGKNSHGQCGRKVVENNLDDDDDGFSNSNKCYQIERFKNIKISKISCGRRNSAFISNQNVVYVCGNNFYQQLDRKNRFSTNRECFHEPTIIGKKQLEGFIPFEVSTSLNHSIVLARKQTSSSKCCLFVSGRISYGRLGIKGSKLEKFTHLPCFYKLDYVLDIKYFGKYMVLFRSNMFSSLKKVRFVDLFVYTYLD